MQERLRTVVDFARDSFAALTGRYAVSGSIDQATHVVAHSFGFRPGTNGERLAGPVNEALALHIGAFGMDVVRLPWVVQEEI